MAITAERLELRQEIEDWKTIRALLTAGGSLPEHLQRLYDRRMGEIHDHVRRGQL